MSDATRGRLHIYRIIATHVGSIRPADAKELLGTCLKT